MTIKNPKRVDSIFAILNKNRGAWVGVSHIINVMCEKPSDIIHTVMEMANLHPDWIQIDKASKGPEYMNVMRSGMYDKEIYLFLENGGFQGEDSRRVLTEKEEQENKELQKKKMLIDLKNAQRVHDTYKTTRIFAWGGFMIAIILAVIKLMETFKII